MRRRLSARRASVAGRGRAAVFHWRGVRRPDAPDNLRTTSSGLAPLTPYTPRPGRVAERGRSVTGIMLIVVNRINVNTFTNRRAAKFHKDTGTPDSNSFELCFTEATFSAAAFSVVQSGGVQAVHLSCGVSTQAEPVHAVHVNVLTSGEAAAESVRSRKPTFSPSDESSCPIQRSPANAIQRVASLVC